MHHESCLHLEVQARGDPMSFGPRRTNDHLGAETGEQTSGEHARWRVPYTSKTLTCRDPCSERKRMKGLEPSTSAWHCKRTFARVRSRSRKPAVCGGFRSGERTRANPSERTKPCHPCHGASAESGFAWSRLRRTSRPSSLRRVGRRMRPPSTTEPGPTLGADRAARRLLFVRGESPVAAP